MWACSSKGRLWGRTTAGVPEPATSAMAFCPAWVTTTSECGEVLLDVRDPDAAPGDRPVDLRDRRGDDVGQVGVVEPVGAGEHEAARALHADDGDAGSSRGRRATDGGAAGDPTDGDDRGESGPVPIVCRPSRDVCQMCSVAQEGHGARTADAASRPLRARGRGGRRAAPRPPRGCPRSRTMTATSQDTSTTRTSGSSTWIQRAIVVMRSRKPLCHSGAQCMVPRTVTSEPDSLNPSASGASMARRTLRSDLSLAASRSRADPSRVTSAPRATSSRPTTSGPGAVTGAVVVDVPAHLHDRSSALEDEVAIELDVVVHHAFDAEVATRGSVHVGPSQIRHGPGRRRALQPAAPRHPERSRARRCPA